MRVWIDLSNSPHAPLFAPVVGDLARDGHEVVITARAHAQTVELARRLWPGVVVTRGESRGGRSGRVAELASRTAELRRFARVARPDVALSHGSYAQIAAARLAGVPAVTMMDYEHQPANHLSFRLARLVIVPEIFPAGSLRRFGTPARKVLRYPGFKEELYLAGFEPDPAVLGELGINRESVLAIFRSPAEGSLYHPGLNERFERLVARACEQPGVQAVLLPRIRAQAERAAARPGLLVPDGTIDGRSLLALADVTIGGGGTMTRESALLGTPTYTAFAGRLAAVDAELMRAGLLGDLRRPDLEFEFVKKAPNVPAASSDHAEAILRTIRAALRRVTEAGGPGFPRQPHRLRRRA